MEPLVEFLALWWWTAPTALGVGTASYFGVTTGRRRSRRLALNAARVQEQAAVRTALAARADTRSAQAKVHAARGGAPGLALPDARRALAEAKRLQRSTALALRAARGEVRAERARLGATSSHEDLPLVRLVRQHDQVASRWLEYETDVELSIAVPQLSDPRRPETAAFLRAMQQAQWLRPADDATRMDPAAYTAYRDAVADMAAAFDHAEDAALRASAHVGRLPRRATPPNPPQTG
ncbi:hypothetical protein FHX48_002714 [Microbacterium halimionae]|uniref:Uncharacterized protein n=1 Tax=Microbacterium halimionae TaxID=1526413 RepID=A0A7W3JRD0_9MICO|nr:hypothetical protein [Microbacterium halimionae]MBA8817609.1 hypothetical protein [Microbacterium halimionae]NII94319.1 hypothetical protein [Microbacterium halimionae]